MAGTTLVINRAEVENLLNRAAPAQSVKLTSAEATALAGATAGPMANALNAAVAAKAVAENPWACVVIQVVG